MADDVWTKLDNKNSLMQNGTQYRNMQAWSRPCALCRKDFVAYTPGNAPADKPPTVTTCEEHRGAPNCITYGWLAWDGKNVVPGRRMKAADSSAPENEELKGMQENLAEWASVWKTCYPMLSPFGLTGVDTFAAAVQAMYAKHAETFEELQVLKARLAQYELPAALAQQNKMPWS